MAKAILNARVYLAEVDLSGYSNAAALNLKTDLVDCTAFSDTYKDKLAGMTDVIAEVSGFWGAEATTGNPDHKLFDQMGLRDAVLTLCPEAGAVNTTAYFFKPVQTEYTPVSGKVGEMAAFKLHGEGTGELIKGKVMVAKAAKTLTGTSTPYQLGALAAGQSIFCAVHIFTVAGAAPTLDLVLQSDAADTFLSPTSVITFTQKNVVGDDYQSAAGPNTDTWWRLSYTIGGAGPSFTIAVVAGIV